MFKSALWRNEKNKVKVEFRLQFHAAKVPLVGEDALVISVVPADSAKPTVRSEKALVVRDGSCIWENPVYETVKFNRDPKSGKIHERIYYFLVGTGSSKAGFIGEACIDFSNYVEITKVSLVSLPLKHSKTETVLNVSIQRIQEPNDLSPRTEIEENENAKLSYKEHSLKAQFSNSDDENITSNSQDLGLKNVSHPPELNRRASSGSDLTISSSESSSGIDTPWQGQVKNDSFRQDPGGLVPSLGPQEPISITPTTLFEERPRSQWEWLGNSAPEASTDDSSSTPRGTFPRQNLEETSNGVIEKLKSDIAALSRQTEMSELELQTLRKQIVKESKRSQDLFRELACLKKERDVLKEECEKHKSFQRCINDSKTKTILQLEPSDSEATVDELRQELDHAKEVNSALQIQLQKTEESNSKLILSVQELEESLEQKKREILGLSNGSLMKDMAKIEEAGFKLRLHEDDDEEQKALEELVKEHKDAKEAYVLDQQIMDMRSEIEIFKRDKDELEMQLEQLALDYEILKQENHELVYKLEQSQIQEQLKMQYECSSSYATAHELTAQIENLQNELKRQSKESADAFVRISELEAHVKSLEEELEKQAHVFEGDLEALTQAKVEQEQRAITAEEALRKMRKQNANTAEKLQEEFRRLSQQMASTFAANEKLATKAMSEANELRIQKRHLEEMISRTSEDQHSVKGKYDARLHQHTNQVTSLTDQIGRLQLEIEEKEVQLELQKKHAEATQRNLSDEILKLKDEIDVYVAKIKVLSEELGSKEILKHQVEQMKISIKEMEMHVDQGKVERTELEKRIMLGKAEAEEWQKELNKQKCLAKEKELMAGNLQSELDHLHSQFLALKRSIVENELEKEKLRKQLLSLERDLKKGGDEFNSMEKQMMDDNHRAATLETVEPTPEHGSKEVADHLGKIMLVEKQLPSLAEDQAPNGIASARAGNDDHNPNGIASARAGNDDHNSSVTGEVCNVSRCNGLSRERNANDSMHDNDYTDESKCEMALLKERNEAIEEELKDMQERYSQLSLKFAEVEGERQQLSMKLRYMKSVKKRASNP